MTGLSLFHFLKKGASQAPQLSKPLPKAPLETGQLAKPKLSRIVERMLLEEDLQPILSEYIQYSAGADIVLPAEALPAVFEQHLDRPDQLLLIQEVMGNRGEWLARQNPDWAIYTSLSDKEIWQYGTVLERMQYLSKLRLTDPGKAIRLLEDTWLKESQQQQLHLLSSLRLHTSTDDIPFLEKCLAMSDLHIRTLAAKILLTLPTSSYRKSVIAAAQSWFLYNKEDGFQLNNSLDLNALAQQVGMLPMEHNKKLNKSQEKQLLSFILSLLPPQEWERISGQKSDSSFAALQKASFYFVNRAALAESIHLHQDFLWMTLFVQSLTTLEKSHWEEAAILRLLRQLPYQVFAEVCNSYVQFHNNLLESSSVVYFLLMETEHHWPNRLTIRIIQVFQDYLQYASTSFRDDATHYEALLLRLALKSDTSLLVNLQINWPQGSFSWYQWEASVQKMLRILQFRAKMIQAFDT
jgi:hypothetical protein